MRVLKADNRPPFRGALSAERQRRSWFVLLADLRPSSAAAVIFGVVAPTLCRLNLVLQVQAVLVRVRKCGLQICNDASRSGASDDRSPIEAHYLSRVE